MFILALLLTCLLSYVQCTPIYSGDGGIDDEIDLDSLISPSHLPHKSDLNERVISSDELIAAEFLEERPLPSTPPTQPSISYTVSSPHVNHTDGVEGALLFPTYEEEEDEETGTETEDENPGVLSQQGGDYADAYDDVHRVLLLRHRYNDAVPAPLQNLPHDIPADRTIAEVLAENTIKDIQYDEQRIKDLVSELLSHTALQGFGEVYSDDADDNEIPKVFK